MSPQIIIAAVIAAVSFAGGAGGTWKLMSGAAAKKENERAQQQLVDQRLTAATAIRRIDTVSQAQSDAAARMDSLRRSAGAARNELDGLRASSAEALRTASTSLDACVVSAATHSRLLNQCGAEYQALGERASGHVSDIQTLTQGWPK